MFYPSEKCLSSSQHPLHTERDVNKYTCPVGITSVINGTEFTNSSFNEGNRRWGAGVVGGMGDENVKVESEEWGRGNKLGYERKHFWAQSFKIIKRGSQ